MNNIRIIKTEIDVQLFLDEFKGQEQNWDLASEYIEKGVYPIGIRHRNETRILPFVCGVGKTPVEASNSINLQKTIFFDLYPNLINWCKSFNKTTGRILCFRLPPHGESNKHADVGTYYTYYDRYQLCLQGEYEYTVGAETAHITPGTFFWFNNLLPHQAKNISDVDRLAVVLDVQRGL